ncbi:MAG: divergent polysaccharide deacetylase family protein [Deltaproteobacteria bacterium]|nr:divergent polysaccharide deacetylase family protein [Deltaproteobacteria bacterium]
MSRPPFSARFLQGALGAAAGVLLLAILGVALWPRPTTAGQSEAAPLCTPASPCLALVIDDVGREVAALERLLALRFDASYAVLPHARETVAARRLLVAHGREILLHLPLEPENPARESDEPVVLRRAGPIEGPARECLDRVPEAVGVNNHMGSAFSRSEAALGRLLVAMPRPGLWFLDSRTTPESRICVVARRRGTPCVTRDVFLDDPPDPVSIRKRLRDAVSVARKRGWAVIIGHPLPATIEALESGDVRQLGPFFVRLSRVMARVGHGP